MRIAISSKSGCGNTTVCTLLSKRLNYKLINFTFRQMAEERGMDFWDFCKLAEGDDNIDKELDRRQVEMAMAEDNCILGSRLAAWMLTAADLKVYLTADSSVRAARIHKREGGSFEERLAQTEGRDSRDSARYKRIYGIDNNDLSNIDLVIDTSDKSPEEIIEIIIKRISEK